MTRRKRASVCDPRKQNRASVGLRPWEIVAALAADRGINVTPEYASIIAAKALQKIRRNYGHD
jgi:hypothetical protein